MIVQHDDRAISHRQRCERTERSAVARRHLRYTDSFEYPNRCDWRCSHDIQGELETIPLDAITWKYLFDRCGTKAAIRHITQKLQYVPFLQPNSLKLQERRKAFS